MIIDFLASLPGILLAISIHEFGHGFIAYLFGDNTAKKEGRLTIDPIKHIDPVGFLMLMIAHFGWAKPVPVNSNNFKNKRLGMFLVSLAGPIFNIILAIATIYLYEFQRSFIHIEALDIILANIYHYNILFAIFNLLPIPPLDGSKILLSILPYKLYYYYYKYEYVGNIILILLIITNNLRLVIGPMYNGINNLMTIFM
ncbi:site-2 protease family protein [Tepidibacter formicigenes]|uniref:Zn-dependent protease (Includes SpoIVFB) n=1 Tax=Tepidibacter formicigenes DSM 15518 TaxID=1123349 RepID=A0A1M6PDK9_9FIRM|nr:site-2 protease family protein [Tepidibacter formicigenes]SHK05970.1 Zn-dependent protease (includes SpoIVFB) [Tepidibacter formicigenes DSM 15518]